MEKLSKDVAVIGSGAGGLAAALTAVEGGARVILFEKNRHAGGLSNFPLGTFAVESNIQRKFGIPLTREGIFKTIMERTHWKADARLVAAFVNKSASTIEWLQQEGVSFEIWPQYQFPEAQLVGHVVKAPGHFAGLIKILKEKAERMGAEIHLNTKVLRILKDGESINGLIAETQSGEMLQVDSKAVVIASGGFLNNEAMVKQYTGFTPGEDLMALNLPGIDQSGDGIRMAWESGAASDGMALQLIFGPESRSNFQAGAWEQIGTTGLGMIMNQSCMFLWINQQGVRFIDEGISLDPAYTGNAISRQPQRQAYLIFDENMKQLMEKDMLQNTPPGGPPPSKRMNLDEIFKGYMDRGEKGVFMADSLEELSHGLEINTNVLTRTINEYNTACENGRDNLFSKNPKYLVPVKQPKFYAIKIRPGATGTLGGIKINEKAEVLNTQDNVIPGLYAAGDCANGLTSYDFWIAHALAGNPSSFALNTGRLAAENALKYIGK
jgi:fumarate reductase flavoprotein subunit